MNNHKLVALVACCAFLALPATAGTYAARVRAHYRVYHRHYAGNASVCPLHRTPLGELVDCQGWRLRDNAIGWDNSCFNLDYLPSMYACGANGGR